MITSLKNPKVQSVAKLRDARHRAKQGRFVVDGAREITRALTGGVRFETFFVCQPCCVTNEAKQLLQHIDRSYSAGDAERIEVTEQVLEKLAYGNRSEGVVAVAATVKLPLSALRLPSNPLIAVLEGVEKPGNIGAVFRSADAAGLDAVIIVDVKTDLFNPNAIRASLGTLFTIPAAEATSDEVLAWLRENSFTILAARVDGSIPYQRAKMTGSTAIVLGTEATGLTEKWTGGDIQSIRLPMRGIADSLNISVAAAVLFYEALRQRDAAM